MTNPTDADTYGTHKDNLKAALKAQQDAHLANQKAGVANEEDINAWRKGSTPNSGPILSLNQQREIPDGYTVHFENMKADLQSQ